MANTKKLDRKNRKQVKRKARAAFKARLGALDFKERKGLRKHEGTQVSYLKELDAQKATAAEAAAQPEASAEES